MPTFDSTKTSLHSLLSKVGEGKLQLPDFQRGWVWDDEHIRALLVSIARSFPIGTVMLLETGGESRFQLRPVEGVDLPPHAEQLAEELILDGQQRLTSLTQVLKSKKPVTTRDSKKKALAVHYYFNIEIALRGPEYLADSIVTVDTERTVKSNFGRTTILDLSTREREIESFYFPCGQIMDSDEWEQSLAQIAPHKLATFLKFRSMVVEPFRRYMMPVISLKKDTSKQAVCLVFEKVNTGGVPLSVFELVTAAWAADGFNLRSDYFGSFASGGRQSKLTRRMLLRDLQPTDFLQGISLLFSLDRRKKALRSGVSHKEAPGVTAKREHILDMPVSAYQFWSDRLTIGFEQAERFLRSEGFHHPKFLPYRNQVIPLAVVLVHLNERWLEPLIKAKLSRWFWCGVIGELYGGAVETRIALDVQQLLAWINESEEPEPVTVQGAGFNQNRLDTLRSRTSAAYRGLYVLLQREGARDFFWRSRMLDLERDDVKIDIHHVFPKKWCEEMKISPRKFNSIINKTAISYKANRMIGGHSPSHYLSKLQSHAQVQLTDSEMNTILSSHLIEPSLLREDNFDEFYKSRRAALLRLIEHAMGKCSTDAYLLPAEEDDYRDEDTYPDEA